MKIRHAVVGTLAMVAVLSARSAHGIVQHDSVTVFVETFDGAWRDRWSSQSLGRRSSRYEVVERDGNAVLRATADRSASALVRRVGVPVTEDVEVAWRWSVEQPLAGNDRERDRGGDDYAARVFVLFGGEGLDRNTRALLYVWAVHEPVGATYRSPYVDQVATVVLRTGTEGSGVWYDERRDILADYRRAFGELPPPISAIAVMTDADDTDGRAAAAFDDIAVSRRR